ncbi:MAG: DUF4298 domain-containing protein [Neisseria sp.]|uniref:DUF4298 domain-containing protein n=1 Tax=Neisseria sp. TaxID=192066 RepID=UPI0026DAB204|nr:DUF4298 domain-containing protein [Neisseria sp.]MDO4641446.1 DUF4298 domain-containing protein [Neisseria sp.]
MKKKTLDPVAAQARIDEVQEAYRQWVELLPQLEAAQEQWKRGMALAKKMEKFYFDGEYSRYNDALDEGLKLNLETKGEYSVMSEDALWNAFHDQQRLAWQRLRSAVEVLDKFKDQ